MGEKPIPHTQALPKKFPYGGGGKKGNFLNLLKFTAKIRL